MIIFRYSSYNNDTIAAHLKISSDLGSVWWGWWKKQHEPWPFTVGHGLPNDEFEIGLVDRAEGEYYEATCIEFTHEGGALIACPNVQMTPEYYSGDLFPLWMRLRSFTRLTREDWIEKFGEVPTGDETVFLRPDDPEVQQRADSVEEPLAVISTTAPLGRAGILHISDLHFGTDHAYEDAPVYLERESLIELLVNGLPELPAAVVVSGDLTTRGEVEGLKQSRLFLEELALRLGLERECIVVVPGNHDILVDAAGSVVKDYANQRDYRDFLEDFYGLRLGLERVHVIRLSPQGLLAFGTGNSSKYRNAKLMDYGYVGWDRVEPVMAELTQLAAGEDAFTSYVIHHHLQSAAGYEEPTKDRPVSVTLDAGDVVSLASKHGVTAVLHGHQHLPFIGSMSRIAQFNKKGATPSPPLTGAVLTLGAGSLSARVARLSDALRDNSFSFYNVTHDEIRIRTFTLTPARDANLLWDFALPRAAFA